jgi:hypothetical protein
VTIVAFEGIL